LKALTEEDEHLESKDVDVEAVVLDPGLLLDDVVESGGIEDEAGPERYLQEIAGLDGRVSAAVHVRLGSALEEAHRRVHGVSILIYLGGSHRSTHWCRSYSLEEA